MKVRANLIRPFEKQAGISLTYGANSWQSFNERLGHSVSGIKLTTNDMNSDLYVLIINQTVPLGRN